MYPDGSHAHRHFSSWSGALATGYLFALGLGIPLQAESPTTKDIRSQTIFITPIGDNDVGKVIREKLVADLAAHFMILESGVEADLILTGSNVTNTFQQYDSIGRLHTAYRITAMVRLVDRDSHVLWSTSVNNGMLARSATSDVAKKIAEALEQTYGVGPGNPRHRSE
jgi:hypothetical protein